MNLLLALAAGLGGLSIAVLLVGAAPRASRRSRGPFVDLTIAVGAVAGALLRAAPTGNPIADVVFGALLGGGAAWAATRAPHRLVAFVAVAVTVALGFAPLAAGGAGVALGVMALGMRVPPVKAIAGALLGLGLLLSVGPRGGSWREALAALLLVVLMGAAARRASDTAHRAALVTASVVLGYLALAAAGFLVSAIPAGQEMARAARLSQGAVAHLRSGGAAEAGGSLGIAASSFRAAAGRLSQWPARLVDVVPGVAQNADALRALARSGEQVARAGATASRGPGSVRIANGRIDLARVTAASVSVRRTLTAVVEALDSLGSVRSRSLVPPVSEAVDELATQLQEAEPSLDAAHDALRQLPAMLGATAPRRYLLALQNPSELRAAGGIIGGFALMEIDQGRLALTRQGRAPELNRAGDPAARRVTGAEEFLGRYGRFQPLTVWQNLTLSPDWPTVAGVADQLYPQSGGVPVDGVIGVDPRALADLLRATGPLEVDPWPTHLTAETVEQVLLHEQYLFFENPERQEFITDVTAAVFHRLTGEGVGLTDLVSALTDSAAGRNLLVWLDDAEEQRLAERAAVAGIFPQESPDADFISVVNQNSSASKIDWFLHRSTNYDVLYDPRLGRVQGTLRVELRNDAPDSGLPEYVIGGAGPAAIRPPAGTNRTWLSVYSDLDLAGASVDGVPLEMERATELGRNVYSAFVVIPAGSTIAVDLQLEGPVDPHDGSYRVALRSQILPNPESATVRVRYADGWRPEGDSDVATVVDRDRLFNFGFRRSD